MKKLLGWLFILGLLLLVVTFVKNVAGQSIRGVESQDRHAIPAMVFWHTDSLKVTSVGWVDIRQDSVLVIQHIDGNGEAHNVFVIKKQDVDSMSLLKPTQTFVPKKPPIGGYGNENLLPPNRPSGGHKM